MSMYFYNIVFAKEVAEERKEKQLIRAQKRSQVQRELMKNGITIRKKEEDNKK